MELFRSVIFGRSESFEYKGTGNRENYSLFPAPLLFRALCLDGIFYDFLKA